LLGRHGSFQIISLNNKKYGDKTTSKFHPAGGFMTQEVKKSLRLCVSTKLEAQCCFTSTDSDAVHGGNKDAESVRCDQVSGWPLARGAAPLSFS
jgi:hypothetical protein